MLRSVDVGCGAYGSGWIGRWTLVDGFPRCVEAPLSIADTDPALLAEQVAVNRAITSLLEKVEAVEAAKRVLAGDEPLQTLLVTDAAGVLHNEPNPQWLAWLAAQAVMAGMDDDTALLAQTRSGLPDLDGGTATAPYQLALPPVLALNDPTGQTADWVAGAWVSRPLTAAEQATWPLRPAEDIAPAQLVSLLRATLGDEGTQAILARPDIASTLLVASRIAQADLFGPGGWCDRLLGEGVVTATAVTAFARTWPLAG